MMALPSPRGAIIIRREGWMPSSWRGWAAPDTSGFATFCCCAHESGGSDVSTTAGVQTIWKPCAQGSRSSMKMVLQPVVLAQPAMEGMIAGVAGRTVDRLVFMEDDVARVQGTARLGDHLQAVVRPGPDGRSTGCRRPTRPWLSWGAHSRPCPRPAGGGRTSPHGRRRARHSRSGSGFRCPRRRAGVPCCPPPGHRRGGCRP